MVGTLTRNDWNECPDSLAKVTRIIQIIIKIMDNSTLHTIILILLTSYTFYAFYKIKKGEWKRQSYSYKNVLIPFAIHNSIYLIIFLFFLIFFKNFEVAITVWATLFFYSLVWFVQFMIKEKHVKDRLKIERIERKKRIELMLEEKHRKDNERLSVK
jgi:hypothetical protein